MTTARSYHWAPHPGKQTFCLEVSDYIRELHYGGARFGGKTDVGMAWIAKRNRIWHPRYRGLVVRKNAEDLSDWIDRARWMYGPLGAVLKGKPAQIYFPSGARIRTGHMKDSDAFEKYMSHEYQSVLIEQVELIERELDYLKLISSCRSTIPNMPALVMVNSNPGGRGHSWIQKRWRIGERKDCVAYKIPGDGRLMMYIPATIDDNPSAANDPHYAMFLDSMPEPIRSAWRLGRWDIFTGEAFKLITGLHIMDPVQIPTHVPIMMTFDWGWGAPFSVGWWWVDGEGRLVRFAEWYGGSPVKAGDGLHLTDNEIALGIKTREQELGIAGRVSLRLGGRDCFSGKPDYKKLGGSASGPSSAEEFARHGLFLTQGDDTSRAAKIRQFRQRLYVPTGPDGKPSDLPGLRVFNTCKDFIRTIRAMTVDEDNVEDVDTNGEDHAYDEACHACMARPMRLYAQPMAAAPVHEALAASGKTVDPLEE